MENYYVYFHRKASDNTVFYVGIGNQPKYKRAFLTTKNKRSDFWHRIVAKYGLVVEIKSKNLTKKKAIEIEKHFISYYGRMDNRTGCLCNMTNGGDGVCGYSPKTTNKGKKFKPLSKEHKEAIRKSNSGRVHTTEERKKISDAKKGTALSSAVKNKISKSMLGKNGKKTINILSGEEFNSIEAAAKSVGLSGKSLRLKLSGRFKNNTNIRFIK